MSPGSEKAANIVQADRLIGDAIDVSRPDLVALPEIWTCLGGTREKKFSQAEALPEPGGKGGPAYEFLRETARRHKIYVHGGSIGEHAGERLFNTNLVFSPEGVELARYRKMHLFDITTPDGHGYKESAVYGAGDQIVTCDLGCMTAGLTICYDVRFPELFLNLRKAGADLIFVPAAFTTPTGRAHWEILLRARAIETQCWVAAPATTGVYDNGNGQTRSTYGHSLIIDPWGEVVAQLEDEPGSASAEIDLAVTAKVRANMPVLAHRRLA